jgi:hypothetical protein
VGSSVLWLREASKVIARRRAVPVTARGVRD